MTERPDPERPEQKTTLSEFTAEPSLKTVIFTFREMLPVFLAELLMSGIVLGIYAAIGRWSMKVLYSVLLGTGLVLLNFAVMTLTLIRASRAESPVKGQLNARASFLLRMLVMIAILVFALKSGRFDPLAALLPLCYMRIALFVPQIRTEKKEAKP